MSDKEETQEDGRSGTESLETNQFAQDEDERREGKIDVASCTEANQEAINRNDEELRKVVSEENNKDSIERVVGADDQKQKENEKRENEEENERKRKELEELQQTLKEAQDQLENKKISREKNLAIVGNYPKEAFFKSLDSSIKKNSSFIKKLRSITEQQRDSLASEFTGLNLSRFVQEAVAAVVEGLSKLKLADVSCVVHVCGLIHQRYADFSELLRKELIKVFDNYNIKDSEKAANVSKFRVTLRLVGELVIYGVFPDLHEGAKMLTNILGNIVSCDKDNHIYIQVILSFCRHCGEDFAGLTSRKQRVLLEKHNAAYPRLEVISKEVQAIFHQLLLGYYRSLSKHLLQAHKELHNKERRNRHILLTKGELHADKKEAYERYQKSYEKLLSNTSVLADIIDEDMPDLPQDESVPEEELGHAIDAFNPFKHAEYDGESGVWEDEDTRVFYESLIDLKALCPQICYQSDNKSEKKENESEQKQTGKEEGDTSDQTSKDEGENEIDQLIDVDEQFDEKDLEENLKNDGDSGSSDVGTSSSAVSMLEALIQRLPTCVNKDFIDEVATEFMLTCNTKSNRKKLGHALYSVPRTRLDLLPIYSRLVATLDPCTPDLAPELVRLLKGEFKYHVRKKDQINVESKVKTVRFIGELTKFNMYPKGETLHCLKMLLEDFTHHNIEMTCALLEVCGRFLYRSPESHIRTKNLLDLMMRKKTVQSLDGRHITMVENAFYYCNPPEKQKLVQKERPPLHEYIRKLLYKDLSKTTTEKVLRQMRKLPWDDAEVALYTTKCLIRIWNVKYNSIHCAASLLAGLFQYHEDVGLYVVDGILEEIRVGMEVNITKLNQRRVSCVKYLGELYNYTLVESRVIFNVLYSFITFGHREDGTVSENVDPPEHLFRVRLICTLLDTCGQYFDRGSNKRKLDCFLTYFQAYILKKKTNPAWNEKHPFPKDVDYMIADTFELLRPKLKLFTTMEEAISAVESLNKDYQEQIEKVAPPEKSGQETDSSVTQPIGVPLKPGKSSSLTDSPCLSPQLLEGDEEQDTDADEEEREGEHRRERKRVSSEHDEEEGNLEGTADDGLLPPQYEVVELGQDDSDMNRVKVLSPPKPKPEAECIEDQEFMAAFTRVMADDLQNRRSESLKVPSLDVGVPMHLKGQSRKAQAPQAQENANIDANFVLMVKKGNKQQFKDLKIPLTSGLAANIRKKQMAEQAEQEEMKRLVLNYNQRQEEEIYNEMMAQQRQGGDPPGMRGHGRYSKKPETVMLFSNSARRR